MILWALNSTPATLITTSHSPPSRRSSLYVMLRLLSHSMCVDDVSVIHRWWRWRLRQRGCFSLRHFKCFVLALQCRLLDHVCLIVWHPQWGGGCGVGYELLCKQRDPVRLPLVHSYMVGSNMSHLLCCCHVATGIWEANVPVLGPSATTVGASGWRWMKPEGFISRRTKAPRNLLCPWISVEKWWFGGRWQPSIRTVIVQNYSSREQPKLYASHLPSSEGKAKISNALEVKRLAAVTSSRQAEGLK